MMSTSQSSRPRPSKSRPPRHVQLVRELTRVHGLDTYHSPRRTWELMMLWPKRRAQERKRRALLHLRSISISLNLRELAEVDVVDLVEERAEKVFFCFITDNSPNIGFGGRNERQYSKGNKASGSDASLDLSAQAFPSLNPSGKVISSSGVLIMSLSPPIPTNI